MEPSSGSNGRESDSLGQTRGNPTPQIILELTYEGARRMLEALNDRGKSPPSDGSIGSTESVFDRHWSDYSITIENNRVVDISSSHGHFGELYPYVDVAKDLALGVAGNAAFMGIVAAINRYRARRQPKSEKQLELDMAEAVELASAAIDVAERTDMLGEVSAAPPRPEQSRSKQMISAEQSNAKEWILFVEVEGRRDEFRVIIPAGDPATVTIKLDTCSSCRFEAELRLELNRALADGSASAEDLRLRFGIR